MVKIENTNLVNLVVDTYAWIEYFQGSKKGEEVKEFLLSAENVYTPSIVLAEIARKYIRENIPREIVKQRLKIIVEISFIVYINAEIALEAGKTYLELVKHAKDKGLRQKPSLNDALVLAIARKLGAKILTGDKHFKDLEETIWIGE